MPETPDVGTNYKVLKASNPTWSRKKLLAVALDEARKAGNPNIQPLPVISRRKKGKK